MVEINLKEIQRQARLKFVEENKAKAKKFTEEEAIPQLIDAANKMAGYATITVPAKIPVECVVTELDKVLVDCKIKSNGQEISVSWF